MGIPHAAPNRQPPHRHGIPPHGPPAPPHRQIPLRLHRHPTRHHKKRHHRIQSAKHLHHQTDQVRTHQTKTATTSPPQHLRPHPRRPGHGRQHTLPHPLQPSLRNKPRPTRREHLLPASGQHHRHQCLDTLQPLLLDNGQRQPSHCRPQLQARGMAQPAHRTNHPTPGRLHLRLLRPRNAQHDHSRAVQRLPHSMRMDERILADQRQFPAPPHHATRHGQPAHPSRVKQTDHRCHPQPRGHERQCPPSLCHHAALHPGSGISRPHRTGAHHHGSTRGGCPQRQDTHPPSPQIQSGRPQRTDRCHALRHLHTIRYTRRGKKSQWLRSHRIHGAESRTDGRCQPRDERIADIPHPRLYEADQPQPYAHLSPHTLGFG